MISFPLRTGHSMPGIGLGTWQSKPGEVKAAVIAAVEAGYRHIDCAAIYRNEKEVGEAFADLFARKVVAREDLFITSKLWCARNSPADVPVELEKTLSDLGLEYLDLYLTHWPVNLRKDAPAPQPIPASEPQHSIADTWEALSKLPKEKVRSVGVSNFSIKKLKSIEHIAAVPAVNQVELHPLLNQQELIAYCEGKGIHVTAYSPLGSGGDMFAGVERPSLLENDVVKKIAARVNRTPAQVLLRWGIQRGTSVIPKSVNPDRIKSNFAVFDFELTADDMRALSTVEPQFRMVKGAVFCSPDGWYKSSEELFE